MGVLCCSKSLPLFPEGNFHTKSSSSVLEPKPRLFRNFNSFDSIYQLTKHKLGFGSYGDVKLCTDKKLQASKAVKIINKDYLRTVNIQSIWFYNKIDILNKLDHPLIISFHEFFEERDFFYLLMDYHRDGDLLKYLKTHKNLSESTICSILHQLLTVITYLHKQKIAHRDLKPENILISESEEISIKLIDFDTAAVFEENGLSGKYGTFSYMAPETFENTYSEKCDIWSCGMILYTLLAGMSYYSGLSNKNRKSRNQAKKIDFSVQGLKKFSGPCIDLLHLTLEKDPNKRISAQQALQHPWFARLQDNWYITSVSLLEKIVNENFSPLIKAVKKLVFHLPGNETQIAQAEKTFLYLDKDYDGFITHKDLLDFFLKQQSKYEANFSSETIIKRFQNTLDHKISYSEFLMLALDPNALLIPNNLLTFFEILCEEKEDQEKPGKKISLLGLGQRLSESTHWTKDEIEGWSKELEKTGKEFLEYEEFCEAITKIICT